MHHSKRSVIPIGVGAVTVIAVGLYLYFDRNSVLSSIFRSWGIFGILLAILVMTVICITPMPSEGALVLYMKIYGPWWGVFYAWLGAVLSSLVVFILARHIARPLLSSLVSPRRFDQVDQWIQQRGTAGLLFARILPIPGFIVSYIVGTMPSVGLWAYVWTAAVSVIPYYVGSALIYIGVAKHITTWLALGSLALILFWAGGYYVKKKWVKP